MGSGVSVCTKAFCNSPIVETGRPSSPEKYNIQTTQEITEIREDYMESTPRGSRESIEFKYYCPICFCYFKNKSSLLKNDNCCNQPVCNVCVLEYLQGCGLKLNTRHDLLLLCGENYPFSPNANSSRSSSSSGGGGNVLHGIRCPCCSGPKFTPVVIYDDDDNVITLSPVGSPDRPIRVVGGDMSNVDRNLTPLSPLKPGDDFEKMKRKMIRLPSYDSNDGNNGSSGSGGGGITSMLADVVTGNTKYLQNFVNDVLKEAASRISGGSGSSCVLQE